MKPFLKFMGKILQIASPKQEEIFCPLSQSYLFHSLCSFLSSLCLCHVFPSLLTLILLIDLLHLNSMSYRPTHTTSMQASVPASTKSAVVTTLLPTRSFRVYRVDCLYGSLVSCLSVLDYLFVLLSLYSLVNCLLSYSLSNLFFGISVPLPANSSFLQLYLFICSLYHLKSIPLYSFSSVYLFF